MTTSDYNVDTPFSVAVGKLSGRKLGKTSYVLYHQPESYDWRFRNAKPHPLGPMDGAILNQAGSAPFLRRMRQEPPGDGRIHKRGENRFF